MLLLRGSTSKTSAAPAAVAAVTISSTTTKSSSASSVAKQPSSTLLFGSSSSTSNFVGRFYNKKRVLASSIFILPYLFQIVTATTTTTTKTSSASYSSTCAPVTPAASTAFLFQARRQRSTHQQDSRDLNWRNRLFVQQTYQNNKFSTLTITTTGLPFATTPPSIQYSKFGRASSTTSLNMMSSSFNSNKMDSPSAQRNKQVIWEVLNEKVISPLVQTQKQQQQATAKKIRILEVAAGCGVHTEHFVNQLTTTSVEDGKTKFEWYPTDPSKESRDSIQCYINDNDDDTFKSIVHEPLQLTLDENGIQEKDTKDTLVGGLNIIICINMIHISPWEATIGLMKAANELLLSTDESSSSSDGYLVLYGPYKENGTAVESNLNFDESLKRRNPNWGVRDLEQVIETAQTIGNLEFITKVEMPANNLCVIFQRKKKK